MLLLQGNDLARDRSGDRLTVVDLYLRRKHFQSRHLLDSLGRKAAGGPAARLLWSATCGRGAGVLPN
jgi:hypothetical protein